jgi:hypothetical protein
LFAALPDFAGLLIWNLGGAILLLTGIQKLVERPSHRFLILALLLPEIVACMSNSQSNSHIAGLLLLTFAALEKKQPARASVYLMLTVFIKLFTLAFLPLFLLYPNKTRSLLWLCASAAALLIVPVVVTGPSGLTWQYGNWVVLLKDDHSLSSGLGVAGLLQSWTGHQVNKNAILAAGLVLLFSALLRTWFGNALFKKQHTRGLCFCFLMIWVVVFNHKAESPTYIIAMAGIVLFSWMEEFSGTALAFLCAAIICTSLATTDLVPYEIRKNVVARYCIKALVPSLVLLFIWAKLVIAGNRRKMDVSGVQ